MIAARILMPALSARWLALDRLGPPTGPPPIWTVTLADHGAGGDVEGCEQRRGAVAGVSPTPAPLQRAASAESSARSSSLNSREQSGRPMAISPTNRAENCRANLWVRTLD